MDNSAEVHMISQEICGGGFATTAWAEYGQDDWFGYGYSDGTCTDFLAYKATTGVL